MAEVFISVDIESDGPIPGDYSMLEIGACVVGRPELNFAQRGLKPISHRHQREAVNVIGIDRDWLLVHGTDAGTAMSRFARWISEVAGEDQPVFLGNNAPYDWMFVCWYFWHFLGENPFGHAALDIRSYAMGKLGLEWSESSLKRLPEPFALPAYSSHDGLDDARVQGESFRRLRSAVTAA